MINLGSNAYGMKIEISGNFDGIPGEHLGEVLEDFANISRLEKLNYAYYDRYLEEAGITHANQREIALQGRWPNIRYKVMDKYKTETPIPKSIGFYTFPKRELDEMFPKQENSEQEAA